MTSATGQPEPIRFQPAIPVLRMFDIDKAREFYLDWLGFTPGFEHRFAPGMPLYFEIYRNDLRLHLSEHHGDGTPGSAVFLPMTGIRAFHAELRARPYPRLRPGIEEAPWGLTVDLLDPFGNQLRFCERTGAAG